MKRRAIGGNQFYVAEETISAELMKRKRCTSKWLNKQEKKDEYKKFCKIWKFKKPELPVKEIGGELVWVTNE